MSRPTPGRSRQRDHRHSPIRVKLTGTQNHAGGFPMDLRHDPMAGFAEIASGVIDTAHRLGRPAVTTVGQGRRGPNVPAVIPRDIRSPSTPATRIRPCGRSSTPRTRV